MLQKLRNEEEGFTLIELLVVILIIGILAAIALPSFLGQSDKAKDSDAKANARNMVSHLESCATNNSGSYVGCNTSVTSANTGLDVGTGSGQVAITSVSATGYVITATSKTGSTFVITKTSTGTGRTCTSASGSNGGCPSSGSW